MDKKAFILDFIKQSKLAVISTINRDGKPEAAVVGFGQTDDLELVFGTHNSRRKYANIKNNNSVAFVIWEGGKTVQFEGLASELSDEDLPLIKDGYWSKSPDAEKYYANEGQRYFIVKPTWIRYTDITKEPWDITELEF